MASAKSESNGVKRTLWTKQEDELLLAVVLSNGAQQWASVADQLPGRSGKQCRERWHNQLNPEIKKGPWTREEDQIIICMQARVGNRWAQITKMLPGRTDNSVKNRFHSSLKPKLINAKNRLGRQLKKKVEKENKRRLQIDTTDDFKRDVSHLLQGGEILLPDSSGGDSGSSSISDAYVGYPSSACTGSMLYPGAGATPVSGTDDSVAEVPPSAPVVCTSQAVSRLALSPRHFEATENTLAQTQQLTTAAQHVNIEHEKVSTKRGGFRFPHSFNNNNQPSGLPFFVPMQFPSTDQHQMYNLRRWTHTSRHHSGNLPYEGETHTTCVCESTIATAEAQGLVNAQEMHLILQQMIHLQQQDLQLRLQHERPQHPHQQVVTQPHQRENVAFDVNRSGGSSGTGIFSTTSSGKNGTHHNRGFRNNVDVLTADAWFDQSGPQFPDTDVPAVRAMGNVAKKGFTRGFTPISPEPPHPPHHGSCGLQMDNDGSSTSSCKHHNEATLSLSSSCSSVTARTTTLAASIGRQTAMFADAPSFASCSSDTPHALPRSVMAPCTIHTQIRTNHLLSLPSAQHKRGRQHRTPSASPRLLHKHQRCSPSPGDWQSGFGCSGDDENDLNVSVNDQTETKVQDASSLI